METTGHLWAIGYEDTERAALVRDEIIRLGWDKSYLLLFLEGIAVVVRHPDGTYSINRSPSPGVVFFLGVGLAGFLAGLVIGMPLAGAAFGASLAGGAAGSWPTASRSTGTSSARCKDTMGPGTSALFILAEEGDMDKLLPAIRGLGGTILKTNVDIGRSEVDPVHPGRRLGRARSSQAPNRSKSRRPAICRRAGKADDNLGRRSPTMWTFAWQNLITRPSRTALAVVGLTIPVLAFLGLFSISQGIRDLMGEHPRQDAGPDGPARELAEPGLQRPARRHGEAPAEDPGRARRRAGGLEDRPADRRQGRPRGRGPRPADEAPGAGAEEPRST